MRRQGEESPHLGFGQDRTRTAPAPCRVRNTSAACSEQGAPGHHTGRQRVSTQSRKVEATQTLASICQIERRGADELSPGFWRQTAIRGPACFTPARCMQKPQTEIPRERTWSFFCRCSGNALRLKQESMTRRMRLEAQIVPAAATKLHGTRAGVAATTSDTGKGLDSNSGAFQRASILQ